MVTEYRYTTTKGLRDMGLGHGYCGEIDTNVIAWCRSLVHGTDLDHCIVVCFMLFLDMCSMFVIA